MLISNVKIVNHDGIQDGSVEFDENKIIKIHKNIPNTQSSINGQGWYLLPAYIDTHTHGGYGFEFNDLASDNYQEKLQKYLKQVLKEGVATVMATSVTCTITDLEKMAQTIKTIFNQGNNGVIRGWYLEGPFISVEKKGAHDATLIQPIDQAILQKIATILPNNKNFKKMIAVAPEIKNNLNLIKDLVKDYYVAIGHSNATCSQAHQAYLNGANRITHLYNQVSGFHHRHPGIINEAINNEKLFCELITDGKHVVEPVLMNTYKMLNHNQIMIVTDNASCKGLVDGIYKIGNLKAIKKNDTLFLEDLKTIAGSAMPFHKQATIFGQLTKCSMPEFVKFTSYNAAKSLNWDNELGVIKENAESSFVLVDNNYELQGFYWKGKKII